MSLAQGHNTVPLVNLEPSLLDNVLSTKISYAALSVVSLLFSVLDVNRIVELLLLCK